LDKLLADFMEDGREDVPWPVVAAILVLARFCESSSELFIETTWYRRTALEDLLGVAAEKVHTDRLYTDLDQLLPHNRSIEKHLRERLGNLFDLDYEMKSPPSPVAIPPTEVAMRTPKWSFSKRSLFWSDRRWNRFPHHFWYQGERMSWRQRRESRTESWYE
jgi:hypothetical protein